MPSIARAFGAPLGGAVEWVVIAYLVVTAGALLTVGRVADMIGRRPVWLTGLIVFTGGSALCGAAPSLGALIAARALQGLGGALLMAISPALFTGAFPPRERGRALGLNAVTVSLGVSAGPVLGGLIAADLSWRWIFFVNVPLGIGSFLVACRVLGAERRRGPGRFDPLGALVLALGLATLIAALSFGPEVGWRSPLLVGGLGVGALAVVLLPVVERRAAHPIVPVPLLRDRIFASALASTALSFLALFSVSILLPFYLEEVRRFSSAQAGLLLAALPLTIAAIAPASGALADRIGTRWLAAGGLALACLGLVFLSLLDARSSIPDIIWRLMVIGAGRALFQAPNSSALLGAAPGSQQGSASGFLATARVVGESLSVALAGAIFAGLGGAAAGQRLGTRDGHASVRALEQTFTHGFRVTFLVCAGIAALGAIAALARGREDV